MKKTSSFVGMDTNLVKANRLSSLHARVTEIDSVVKRLDDTAAALVQNEAQVTLDMVVVKGTPQVIHEEFNVPPIFIQGYPPITSVMLPKHTNTTVERILLPESITLSMIGTLVAHYNVERKIIMEEIDTILNPNARSKSKTKTVPVARVRE